MVFCSHAAISLWFFLFFGSDFFLNAFPDPFIVLSRSGFLFSQWKFFELYVRTCPAMFFYFVKVFVTNMWSHYHFKSAFCSFVHAISTEIRVWPHLSILVERGFLFIQVINLVTRYLPHSKMTSSLWNWLFFTLIQRDKVTWVYITLIGGSSRAANRSSNKLCRFWI